MSADNWDRCPRCLKRADDEHAVLLSLVQKEYGQIPLEDFNKLQARASAPRSELDSTFREDYEIGILHDRSCFFVNYSASCTECGFSIDFKHTEPYTI